MYVDDYETGEEEAPEPSCDGDLSGLSCAICGVADQRPLHAAVEIFAVFVRALGMA